MKFLDAFIKLIEDIDSFLDEHVSCEVFVVLILIFILSSLLIYWCYKLVMFSVGL